MSVCAHLHSAAFAACFLRRSPTHFNSMQFGTCAIASGVFRSLAVSDVEALHLIRQCRFLEPSLNTNFTTRILSSHQEISFSQLKKEIIEVDFSLLLSEASNHASQRYVQAVAASSISSWPKAHSTDLPITSEVTVRLSSEM